MTQKTAIDTTGQIVTKEQQDVIVSGIVGKSAGAISQENITFFTQD